MNLNPSKNTARPSHEAIKPSHTGDATNLDKNNRQRVDRTAMESATRAQDRLHNNEEKIPGSKMFTK